VRKNVPFLDKCGREVRKQAFFEGTGEGVSSLKKQTILFLEKPVFFLSFRVCITDFHDLLKKKPALAVHGGSMFLRNAGIHLHGVLTQKATILTTTAVKTSKLKTVKPVNKENQSSRYSGRQKKYLLKEVKAGP
jgi:hypothetical protein